jgi:hypothetical protein
MDRPGCHASIRCVVSVYLASLADAAPLPRCPGVSKRALRSALRMMCRIAQNDGSMRYGLRASKLAELCDYSVATIHRAERLLIERGYIERVRKGGGRISTRWRIVIDKLTPASKDLAVPPGPPQRVNALRTGLPHWLRPSFGRPTSTVVTSVCEHGGDGERCPMAGPDVRSVAEARCAAEHRRLRSSSRRASGPI